METHTPMSSRKQVHTYIWGSNGFNKVSQLLPSCSTIEDDLKDRSTDSRQCCGNDAVCFKHPLFIPGLTGIEAFVSNWERLVFVTEKGELCVQGFTHDTTVAMDTADSHDTMVTQGVRDLTECQSQKSSRSRKLKNNMQFVYIDTDVNICLVSGKTLLFKKGDNSWYVLPEGEITPSECILSESKDTGMIQIASATYTDVYFCDASDVYKACLDSKPHRFSLSLERVLIKEPVHMVACGFEHVLILCQTGTVFSSGIGSRGQLGHGVLTVDEQKSIRVIEMLEGLQVSSVSAGGWHSAAITDTGDLYMWGWNESGQLGLPNRERTPTDLDNSQTELFPLKNITSVEKTPIATGDCRSKSFNVNDGELPVETLPEDINKHATSGDQMNSDCRKERGTEYGLQGDSNSSHRSNFETEFPIQLSQDTDAVQVQTEPYLIDIPDTACVRTVQCGTRHTALLLDSGCLLTTGWNEYGQLGLGHTVTMDSFNTVTYFTKRGLYVIDVFCNGWNTAATVRGELTDT